MPAAKRSASNKKATSKAAKRKLKGKSVPHVGRFSGSSIKQKSKCLKEQTSETPKVLHRKVALMEEATELTFGDMSAQTDPLLTKEEIDYITEEGKQVQLDRNALLDTKEQMEKLLAELEENDRRYYGETLDALSLITHCQKFGTEKASKYAIQALREKHRIGGSHLDLLIRSGISFRNLQHIHSYLTVNSNPPTMIFTYPSPREANATLDLKNSPVLAINEGSGVSPLSGTTPVHNYPHVDTPLSESTITTAPALSFTSSERSMFRSLENGSFDSPRY